MHSYGIVRKIDPLGRIVIPIEQRRRLDIEIGDPIEFHVDGDTVVLKKYDDAKRCDVTGERAVFSLLEGELNLSEEGCARLLDELKAQFSIK